MPFLFLVLACDYGLTLPSSDPPTPTEDLKPGVTTPIRTRRNILPGQVTGPPPPDAGLTGSQCGAMSDGGPVGGDGCVTAELHCNETIVGNTNGGVAKFDTRFYEQFFCTPATTNHDGFDERVYRLKLEPDTRALVYLDTPCADLDLAAVKFSGDECPTGSSMVNQCEELIQSGTKREKVDLWNQGDSQWYVIVEGKDDEEGSFALTVQCEHLKWRGRQGD